MGHGGDVLEELCTDHREVEDLFGQIEAAPSGSPARKRLVDQVTTELVRHSAAEEQYLYPAVRTHVAGGDGLTEKELADHALVEEILNDLDKRAPDDVEFDRLFVRLRDEVTAHLEDEETHLFTFLRASCPSDDLMHLGEEVRRAKRIAPTRPHPDAPDTPPANKLLGPVAGMVDRLRDALTGRGKS